MPAEMPTAIESLARVRTVAYHGGPVKPQTQPKYANHPMVFDLSGITVANFGRGLPILFAHDQRRPIGHASMVTIGTSIVAAGVLSVPSSLTTMITNAASNGYRWAVSVGIAAQQIETIPPSRPVVVNRRSLIGPLHIVRAGWLGEFSLLTIGSDRMAFATITPSPAAIAA